MTSPAPSWRGNSTGIENKSTGCSASITLHGLIRLRLLSRHLAGASRFVVFVEPRPRSFDHQGQGRCEGVPFSASASLRSGSHGNPDLRLRSSRLRRAVPFVGFRVPEFGGGLMRLQDHVIETCPVELRMG